MGEFLFVWEYHVSANTRTAPASHLNQARQEHDTAYDMQVAGPSRERATTMNNQTEGLFAIVAAFVVLFSAMLDPKVSVILAVAGLALYGIYKLTEHRAQRS
jgi:hypothetical protein